MIYAIVTSDIKGFLDLLGNPWANVQSLNDLVPHLINLVLVVAVVVFLFLLIIGGIRWITAGGDKTALEGAQKTITSALVGIILVFSAWAILNLVRYFFGLRDIPQGPCRSVGAVCGAGLPECCPPYTCHGVCTP